MTGDLFDRLQEISDRIESHRKRIATAEKKLGNELETLETHLLLADCLSALRLVSTRNMSEGQRHQIAGIKRRIQDAIGRAA